jgi:hypothetical protein
MPRDAATNGEVMPFVSYMVKSVAWRDFSCAVDDRVIIAVTWKIVQNFGCASLYVISFLFGAVKRSPNDGQDQPLLTTQFEKDFALN